MSKKLELEIAPGPEGRSVIHFPFMSISDIHLGTGACRARRLCQMLENTAADQLHLVGDIVDGQALAKKKHWKMGRDLQQPYHRQGIAHFLRKAGAGAVVNFYGGNHEYGLEVGGFVVKYDSKTGQETLNKIAEDGQHHRRLAGKSIYGIRFHDKSLYTDPAGRRFRIEHGHLHDLHLFKTAENANRWYGIGEAFVLMGNRVDRIMQPLLRKEDFTVIAPVKKVIKKFINENLGVREGMAENIDKDPGVAGVIYGHSHMGGFEKTENAKAMMNDGCATDHVNALVHDRNGAWALLVWHKDSVDVLQEDGQEYKVFFKDLGLEHFSEPAQIYEDEYTDRADRLMRLMYRLWPPKERHKNMEFLAAFEEAAAKGQEMPMEDIHRYFNILTEIHNYNGLPIPRPDIQNNRKKKEEAYVFSPPEFDPEQGELVPA